MSGDGVIRGKQSPSHSPMVPANTAPHVSGWDSTAEELHILRNKLASVSTDKFLPQHFLSISEDSNCVSFLSHTAFTC